MSDAHDSEELVDLPDDLKGLDEELSSIRYEERPSFRPELRAELARAWAERGRRRPASLRHLAAAALGGLLLIGASAPAARASLVRLLEALTPEEVVLPVPPAEAAAPVASAIPGQVPDLGPQPVGAPAETPPPPTTTVGVVAAGASAPARMLDRERAVRLLEQAYPPYLQRQGVGGVVWLRVWVDTNGLTGLANVLRSSGVSDLDRAALDVAPLLRFEPALQGGAPVATWIEFPVYFEPDETEVLPAAPVPTEDPLRLPLLHPDDRWEFERPLDLDELGVWAEAPLSELSEAEAALVDALGDPIVRRSLGPIESVLSGIAPSGRDPTEWRAAATGVLEDAIGRSSDNPAPLLALGRIRLRQGLKTDARMLFERGLQIAIQTDSEVVPSLVAELHHERGRLIREKWLASRGVGRVHASGFEEAACAEARSYGAAASGFASVERLIAWNYLCPKETARVFEAGFEATGDGFADLGLMMGSFRAALAADPGHADANVGLLMALVEAGRWDDVLAGARRFARHSGGHPHALLLAGLALLELERAEEADLHFTAALERLPAAEEAAIRDVTYVIDPDLVPEYDRLWGEQRRAWEESYWRARDRTPGTPVLERELEHLARSTYAQLRFGGVTSDAGQVWVRFGGPEHVHVVDAGAGQLTEFWDYGSGPDITFVRSVSSQSMDLTPEGRAYVDDLGKIFPPQ